jgi:hypothetical protein
MSRTWMFYLLIANLWIVAGSVAGKLWMVGMGAVWIAASTLVFFITRQP